MALDETMVGARMAIRSRVPGETGPTGGPAMTDVIGRVLSVTGGDARVERRDGSVVDVRLDDVVSARRVPDGRRRVRTRPAGDFSPEELSRICTRGWPPTEAEPLGEWMLRAAGGFTGRANSAAVHGDPGVGFEQALSAIGEFYAARGLPAKAQVIDGSAWEPAFERAGWHGIGGAHGHAVVQVADVATALAAASDTADPAVAITDTVDDDWLAMYNRAATTSSDQARAVLEGPPTVGFVRYGEPLTAIGRVAVTGEWAGMGCVEVAPEYRSRGIARRIVEASLRWASGRGADKVYLQTMRHNEAALRLYAAYGFTDHHAYRYLTP